MTGRRIGAQLLAALCFWTLLLSTRSLAYSEELLCLADETECLVDDLNLAIGERVMLVNNDDELVADGHVESIRKVRRTVRIDKRYGPITADCRVLVYPNEGEVPYQPYTRPPDWTLGGAFDSSRLRLGNSGVGTGLHGWGQYRAGLISLSARGGYWSFDGEVTREVGRGIESRDYSVKVPYLAGGIVYTLFEKRRFSIRGEALVGIGNVSVAIDGISDIEQSGFDLTVFEGTGFLTEFEVAALLNFASTHIGIFAGTGTLQEASHVTVGALLMVDLPRN